MRIVEIWFCKASEINETYISTKVPINDIVGLELIIIGAINPASKIIEMRTPKNAEILGNNRPSTPESSPGIGIPSAEGNW